MVANESILSSILTIFNDKGNMKNSKLSSNNHYYQIEKDLNYDIDSLRFQTSWIIKKVIRVIIIMNYSIIIDQLYS